MSLKVPAQMSLKVIEDGLRAFGSPDEINPTQCLARTTAAVINKVVASFSPIMLCVSVNSVI